ncbi:MAG: hypothetical protein H6812_13585 [Phycisphaeraceae bacterium]|nr:hypothetical protein [Phycisphaerales bacterium]MCB9844270.1 hypothetical protein [Phycisphaeraceae bacterium]
MGSKTHSFEAACQDAVGSLRAALVALFDSIGVDPSVPQDVARRYHLNKTLTWNISRLLQAPDSIAAVPHVPGTQALEKMLKATSDDGASAEAVKRVRAASRAFDEIVEVHVGDRTTLDLVLDGMANGSGGDGLELSRKLAYRGNSGLYGVQAKARVMAWTIAPNAEDSSLLDLAMISGYAGFRRLRNNVRWPIIKVRSWATSDQPITRPLWHPLEGDPNSPMALMPSFSSIDEREIDLVTTEEGLDCHLLPGRIGNVGAFDCIRGEMMMAAANRYKDDEDSTGEVGASITTPSEVLLFDLIVHRDLENAMEPEAMIFSRIVASGVKTPERDDESALPIRLRLIDLPGTPPAMATPLVPRYSEITGLMADRLGRRPEEFRAKRLLLDYPPLNSNVILRFPLLPAPR